MGFFAPVSEDDAAATWANDGAALDSTPLLFYMFIATDPAAAATGQDEDRVIATVQLAVQAKQTHQHRAELRRLIVLPEYQGRGYGRAMAEYAESFSRDDLGLEILTLSTGTITPARQFYLRAGWTEWGVCPGYAKGADGSKQDISFFYKDL
jgi:GNAT superfamily N-acetyltransferase